jgi:hypothetical protein
MRGISDEFMSLPSGRRADLLARSGVGLDEWSAARGADRDALVRRAAERAMEDRRAARESRGIFVGGRKYDPSVGFASVRG